MNETTILLALKLIMQNQSKLAELFLLALMGKEVNKQQVHQAMETMMEQNKQVTQGLDDIMRIQSQQFGPGSQQAQSIHDLFNQMLGRQGPL